MDCKNCLTKSCVLVPCLEIDLDIYTQSRSGFNDSFHPSQGLRTVHVKKQKQ
jgi:hypothetical protein